MSESGDPLPAVVAPADAPPAARRARRSPPGFRFSASDAVVIAATVAATAMLRGPLGVLALLPAIVLGHFFLFCNVFRVRRSYELLWAVVFVVNLSAWWMSGRFGWGGVLLAQTPATLGCLALELLSPRYHGVGYDRLGRLRSRQRSFREQQGGRRGRDAPDQRPPSSRSTK